MALYWILGIDRVEIRDLIPRSCWHHCPGVDNPANLPSRGVKPSDLAQSELWVKGPVWLGAVIKSEPVIEMPTECCVELRAKDRPVALSVTAHSKPSLEQIIDCQGYSPLRRLFSVTVLVLKFAHNLKERTKGATEGRIAIPDSARAEVLWIQAA